MGYYVTEFYASASHVILSDFTCEFCGCKNHVETVMKEGGKCQVEYHNPNIVPRLSKESEDKLMDKVYNKLIKKLEVYMQMSTEGDYRFIGECACKSCGKHPSWTALTLKDNAVAFVLGGIIIAAIVGAVLAGAVNNLFKTETNVWVYILICEAVAAVLSVIKIINTSKKVKQAKSNTVTLKPDINFGGTPLQPTIINRRPS